MAHADTALDQYFDAVRDLQVRVVEGQRNVLLQVAEKMTETTRNN